MNQKELEYIELENKTNKALIDMENEMLFRKLLIRDLINWCITSEYYNKCITKLNK